MQLSGLLTAQVLAGPVAVEERNLRLEAKPRLTAHVLDEPGPRRSAAGPVGAVMVVLDPGDSREETQALSRLHDLGAGRVMCHPRPGGSAGTLGSGSAVTAGGAGRVDPRTTTSAVVVVRIAAGTCATCSVNVRCGQSVVRQRQRRLRHCTASCPPPHGRSCGRVSTQSFPDVDTTRQPGQRAASGSSVTSCTTLVPPAVSTTRSTAKPSRPNKHDASSVRSTTVRGSPFAAPEHSEDQGVAGRPRSGAPHGPNLRLPGQD